MAFSSAIGHYVRGREMSKMTEKTGSVHHMYVPPPLCREQGSNGFLFSSPGGWGTAGTSPKSPFGSCFSVLSSLWSILRSNRRTTASRKPFSGNSLRLGAHRSAHGADSPYRLSFTAPGCLGASRAGDCLLSQDSRRTVKGRAVDGSALVTRAAVRPIGRWGCSSQAFGENEGGTKCVSF